MLVEGVWKLNSKPRNKLIKLRKERKLSQKQVATALKITTSYYGMIEQGIRTPALDIAVRIAEFYDKNIEEILCAKK